MKRGVLILMLAVVLGTTVALFHRVSRWHEQAESERPRSGLFLGLLNAPREDRLRLSSPVVLAKIGQRNGRSTAHYRDS